MKRFSLLLSLALVAVLSISLFAFRPAKPALQEQWFMYNGTDDSHINDPAYYQLSTGGEPNCGGAGVRCAAFVLPDPNEPTQPQLEALEDVEPGNIKKRQ
ncbi:MAG: hypothetical protein JWP69_1348 [Flaviaesturariibacter sp.]|nr:hypothetical protein [Flaviaesturariibacter sp.]